MKVVIVGAGGLGSYVGAVASQAGHDVVLVARGDHRKAIEADGLQVKSFAGDFTVHPECVGDATELDGADLTFLVTKTYSLDEVAPQLVHLAKRGSAVVSLLNGVTAVERLADHGVPRDRLADGVAYMTSFRVAPGVVERRAEHQKIVVGDAAGGESGAGDPSGSPGATGSGDAEPSGPSALVASAFADTIVDIEVRDDISVELWRKMSVVCSLSVLCAIGERNIGSIRGHEFGRAMQRQAIGEVLDVGRARGVPIPPEADAEIDEVLDRFPDDFFPSVIHDLNGGGRTEMDDLGGAIARMGREAAVPTPLHDAGTCIVQLAEGAGG